MIKTTQLEAEWSETTFILEKVRGSFTHLANMKLKEKYYNEQIRFHKLKFCI
jgi:hypothetical protein